ncbi:MAG: hypothetical protein GX951_01750 [Mollicutes bacterium]|nr:hypothetical protein [Mollicutes bacterium]
MARIKAKIDKNKKEIKSKGKKSYKKQTKQKLLKDNSFDGNEELRRSILILVIMIIIIIGIYFLSAFLVDKRSKENKISATKINYDVTLVGTILNRPYDEYYVLVYNKKEENANYYNQLFDAYKEKEDAIKIYYCDLSNKLNEDYVSDKSNKNIISSEDFKFKGTTLLKIKDGKVISFIEDNSTIETLLQ